MSKFLLLLVSVAAFQAVSSFPTDYLEDPAPKSTWSIMKDAMDEIKNNWIKKGEEMKEKTIKMVMEKICIKQDFEEDFDSDESSEGGLVGLYKELMKLIKDIPTAFGQEKKKMEKKMENVKGKICDLLGKKVQEDESAPKKPWWSLVKDTMKQMKEIKDKWAEKGKKVSKDVIRKLMTRFCQEQDFEEDFDSDEASKEGGLAELYSELQKLIKKIPQAIGDEKNKMKKKMEEMKTKICDKLQKLAVS